MCKKILSFSLLAVLCFSMSLQAQDETSGEGRKGLDPSRLFFGGNFGLTFGDFTFINVTPQVGYRISPVFSAGVGANFIYQSDKYYSGSTEVKSTLGYAGLNVFGRVNPFRVLILNVQPELNYVWGKTTFGNLEEPIDSKFVPSLLLGGGVAIPTGGRGSLIAMLQYDVIQDFYSPYGSNAFFTFGYNF
jgi:hypothetical protein